MGKKEILVKYEGGRGRGGGGGGMECVKVTIAHPEPQLNWTQAKKVPDGSLVKLSMSRLRMYCGDLAGFELWSGWAQGA